MIERILCAAIHYKDDKTYEQQPVNITSGIVVTGRRHNNCIATIQQLMKAKCKYELCIGDSQGFLTSTDRFVTRAEAYQIAKEAGQLLLPHKDGVTEILTSEDLY